MSEDERILRRRAWWGLYIWDKLCSYLLGRPHMVRRQVCDVTLPPVVDADGVRNMFNLGQGLMLKLVNYITDCMDTCFGAKYPDSVTFLEMGNKLAQWEAEIPPEYRQGHVLSPSEELSSQDILTLARQRYILYTWYLFGRLKLVVAATTGNPVRTAESPAARKECLERCIIYSMELIKFQCDAYEAISAEKDANPTLGATYPGNSWLFSGCFSLFEASVALLTTLAKYSWHEQMVAAGRLIGRVLDVLAEVRLREEGKTGETASMAIEVLTALRDQKLWKSDLHTPVVQHSPESWNGGDSSNSPDNSGATPSMYMEHTGERPNFGQPQLSNHYAVSAIRGDARTQGPKFSTNILTQDASPPLPARLS
ncbi:hypothetical protein BDQ17DRAFT_1430384 [Cyathus striatus]|nr:hypothetical protein BDQ17DRAFT_1430384 [Cyathus striatus]